MGFWPYRVSWFGSVIVRLGLVQFGRIGLVHVDLQSVVWFATDRVSVFGFNRAVRYLGFVLGVVIVWLVVRRVYSGQRI